MILPYFTHDIPLPLGANPMVSPWGHPGGSPGERWQRKGPKEVPGTASFAAKDGMQWLKVKQRRKQRILTGKQQHSEKDRMVVGHVGHEPAGNIIS